MMDRGVYETARSGLLSDDCKKLLELEKLVTEKLMTALVAAASNIKSDFDQAGELMPYWEEYAPVQRGYKPRGEAFPWGEVGEKVIEGHLYSIIPSLFEEVSFMGVPFGHDIRFLYRDAFVHIDVKSTGPTDNADEVVSSPNQVTGTGDLNDQGRVVNAFVDMKGPNVTRQFRPELAPFYIINGVVIPTVTYLYSFMARWCRGTGDSKTSGQQKSYVSGKHSLSFPTHRLHRITHNYIILLLKLTDFRVDSEGGGGAPNQFPNFLGLPNCWQISVEISG